MGATQRPYTKQFKQQAVQLVMQQGHAPARTARGLGIPYTTLLAWLEKAGWRRPEPDMAVTSDDPALLKTQIRELQRRLKRSEMEKEILKKATAYFASLRGAGLPSSADGEESSQ
jgi:transposase